MQRILNRFRIPGARATIALATGIVFWSSGLPGVSAASEAGPVQLESADEGAALLDPQATSRRSAGAREALGASGARPNPVAARLSPERKGQLGGVLPLNTPTTVVTPVVSELTFLTDPDQLYRIEVPPSAGRLQVDLVMDDPAVGVGLLLRRGSAPVPTGSNPQVDAFGLSPFGWQSVVIGKESQGEPLQPGTYFLALVAISTGRSGTGVLTATVRPETFRGIELRDDQATGYLRTPRPSPVLWTGDLGFVVDVPAEATSLRIRTSFNNDVDVDLHVRQGQPVDLSGGRVIDDFRARRRVRGGAEEIVIDGSSSPPLAPGLYFISTGVITRNEAAVGLMLADLTCPIACPGGGGGAGGGGGSGGGGGGPGGGGTTTDLGSPTTVSAASFVNGEAAIDSMVTSFAAGMTTGGNVAADTLPLPIILAGTTIQVIDVTGREGFAELFFGGTGQANWRVPDWATPGQARVIFRREDGQQQETTLQLTDVQPGLFSADATGQGAPAAVVLYIDADGNQTTGPVAECDGSGCRPAVIDLSDRSRQVVLLAFGTGFRRAGGLTASVGGVDVPVLGFGAQGQFVSLDQANIALSGDQIPDGRQMFSITADGKTSNTLMLEFTGGVPPPPPPPPTLSSLSSASVRQGQNVSSFTLTGTNMLLVDEIRVNPPDGLSVGNIRPSEERVLADLSVALDAPVGERLLSVVSPGGESNALPLLIETRPAEPSPPMISNLVVDQQGTGQNTRTVIAIDYVDADGDVNLNNFPAFRYRCVGNVAGLGRFSVDTRTTAGSSDSTLERSGTTQGTVTFTATGGLTMNPVVEFEVQLFDDAGNPSNVLQTTFNEAFLCP